MALRRSRFTEELKVKEQNEGLWRSDQCSADIDPRDEGQVQVLLRGK
jgi:hypothetical protein